MCQPKRPCWSNFLHRRAVRVRPAADKILFDLETSEPIAEAEIITLAWHVDYWDSGGWKDESASPFFGQRQVAYSRALNIGETYTPQMFVDGATHSVGTKLDKATKAINQAARSAKPEINISINEDKLKINIPNLPKHNRATVFLRFYRRRSGEKDRTRKQRGQNARTYFRRAKHPFGRDARSECGEFYSRNFFADSAGMETRKSENSYFCAGKRQSENFGGFEKKFKLDWFQISGFRFQIVQLEA